MGRVQSVQIILKTYSLYTHAADTLQEINSWAAGHHKEIFHLHSRHEVLACTQLSTSSLPKYTREVLSQLVAAKLPESEARISTQQRLSVIISAFTD